MNEQFINDLSKELAKLGTIHSVGEEWISYTGKIPSGGIPYCGQEITRETYSALWSWVQAQGLVKTESEWQSIASSQNGNVPFYSSGNGTTTFRMPKLVGYVKGASSKAESGSYVKEGLPNITGVVEHVRSSAGKSASSTGAIQWRDGETYPNNVVQKTDYTYASNITLDASRSNAIYGNSNHVTPETSVVLFGVYAFGTVSNPNDLNVSNLASDINSIKTSYLPLSGGTMTGNIRFNGNYSITTQSSENQFSIFQGNSASQGAGIWLYGNDNSGEGKARIQVYDNANSKFRAFDIRPDGAVVWDGKNVVCVESWVSGTSWYRKYSDGWIEQGGFVEKGSKTITLFKAMKNANYAILMTCKLTSGERWGAGVNNAVSITTTSFGLTSINSNSYHGMWWQVSGYCA